MIKTLKLLALSIMLLNGLLCLQATDDHDQSGYTYIDNGSTWMQQASRSIFLCSDKSVVVFSNFDFQKDINTSYQKITKLDPQGNLLWMNEVEGDPCSTNTGVDVDDDDSITFIHEDGRWGSNTIQLYKASSSGIISIIGPPTPIYLPHSVTFNKALRTSDGDIVTIGRIIDGFSSNPSSQAVCFYRFSAQGDTLASAYWPRSNPSFSSAAYDMDWLDNGNLLISCALSAEFYSILEVNLDGEIINRFEIPVVYSNTNQWRFGLNISKETGTQSHIVAYSSEDSICIDRFCGGGLERLFSIPRDMIRYLFSMIINPDYIILCGEKHNGGTVIKLDWEGNIIWNWLITEYGENYSDYNWYGVPSKSLLTLDDQGCVYWAWGRINKLMIGKLLPNGQVPIQDDVQVPALNTLTAYPNPMNRQLSIKVDPLLRDDSIAVYNIKGKLVRSLKLLNGETVWDGKDHSGYDCPSGIYLLRTSNEKNLVKKISKIN